MMKNNNFAQSRETFAQRNTKNKLCAAGELTSRGAYKMPDGRTISKHISTSTELPTISINEPGKRLQKIRFEK